MVSPWSRLKVFDRHFQHKALGPQTEEADKLNPSTIQLLQSMWDGEAKFPIGWLDESIYSLCETVDTLDTATRSLPPTFAMWGLRKIHCRRRIAAVKRRVYVSCKRTRWHRSKAENLTVRTPCFQVKLRATPFMKAVVEEASGCTRPASINTPN